MEAQIGWIDFSEKDRKKALDVIHLLQEQGAVDELGIGIVRDAFANIFFPGTSTVQTRAKYFFIVPYVMKEACDNSKNTTLDQIIRIVDSEERKCAVIMGDNDGVIGRDAISTGGWVERRPSNIYWNGIKKLGIFTYPKLSAYEYYREELIRRSLKANGTQGNRSGEENEQDDDSATASGRRSFWNLPPEYDTSWHDNLTIDLQPWEAKWMRKCISENLQDSLFKHIVDNNIDVELFSTTDDAFKALTEFVYDDVTENMKCLLTLANQFNSLVFLCRILYNIVLSDGNNEKANELWQSEQNRMKDVENLNIDLLINSLNISNRSVKLFLSDMKTYLVEGMIDKAKERVIKREIQLKGSKRAKLMRRGDFKNDAWIGGYLLDYRFGPTARLIKDMYNAEKLKENV